MTGTVPARGGSHGPEQRAPIADLLGRDRLPGRSTASRVTTLVTALGLSGEGELRRLVEQIVCSSGRPSVAVVTLIRQLAPDGAARRQHADARWIHG